MLTWGIKLLLVVGIGVTAIYGIRFGQEKSAILSEKDAMGFFAYIGVTFFFMASTYGLKYSMTHKRSYGRQFWRKRLRLR